MIHFSKFRILSLLGIQSNLPSLSFFFFSGNNIIMWGLYTPPSGSCWQLWQCWCYLKNDCDSGGAPWLPPDGLTITSAFPLALHPLRLSHCLPFGLDLGFLPTAFTMGPPTQLHRHSWLALIHHPFFGMWEHFRIHSCPKGAEKGPGGIEGGNYSKLSSI